MVRIQCLYFIQERLIYIHRLEIRDALLRILSYKEVAVFAYTAKLFSKVNYILAICDLAQNLFEFLKSAVTVNSKDLEKTCRRLIKRSYLFKSSFGL